MSQLPPPQLPAPLPRASAPRVTNPRDKQRNNSRSSSPYPVANALIAINLGIFAWMGLTNSSTLGMNGGISDEAYLLGVSRDFIAQGEWYRMVSSGFVHFGILHVAMNMYILYHLGRMLEPSLGSFKFGLVYFASLLAGSTGALLLTPNAFTGGASGAVFGLMAAAVVGMRQRGVNPFRTGLGATFAINIIFTLAIPGISVGGHFGGALAGAACGAVLFAPRQWRLPNWAQIATPLAVGAAAIAVVSLYIVR